MTKPTLQECRAKLARADHHRGSFERVFDTFLNQDPYSITVDFDPESGWHDFRWKVDQDAPVDELALIFGDILTNLRSALDYLVWQLVVLAGKQPTDRNSFPIVRNLENWRSARSDRLRGVEDRWIDKLNSLQPYHSQDAPDLHPLAILDRVNNINKHRALPLGVVSTAEWRTLIDVEAMAAGDQLEFHSFPDEPIEDDGSLFRFRWKEERRRLEVPLVGKPTFRVLFVDGVERVWTIDEIFQSVRDCLSLFETAFDE